MHAIYTAIVLDNFGVDEPMGQHTYLNAPYKLARVMCTTTLLLDKEEHCFGMHIYHGYEQVFMVLSSFCQSLMSPTLLPSPIKKFPSSLVKLRTYILC